MLTVLHELTTLDSTAFFPLVLIDLPTGAALTVLFSGLTPQNRRKTRPKGRLKAKTRLSCKFVFRRFFYILNI